MNYKQAREYMKSSVSSSIEPGLDNIRNIMNDFGNVQDSLNIIHTAGTNGKGSTSAFICRILAECGFKAGMYISPAVTDYTERIQINSHYIPEEEFAEIITELYGKKATAFELETAAAFLWFYRQKCDFVVLETGLGGSLDATNIISKNLCSVITPISIDHTAFLGKTLAQIAEKKAGIIKTGCPCISAEQCEEVENVLINSAKKVNSEISFVDKSLISNISVGENGQKFDYKSYKNIQMTMRGVFQFENAALAIECIQMLISKGINIPERAVYDGIKNTYWQARFETVMKKPLFIIDGAHNKAAAEVLAQSIDLYLKDKKKIFIIGIMEDKDYNSILSLTAHKAEKIYAVTPDNPRAMDNEKLCAVISHYNSNVKAESIENAVKESIKAADENTAVVAFGSLYYLGEVKRIIKSFA